MIVIQHHPARSVTSSHSISTGPTRSRHNCSSGFCQRSLQATSMSGPWKIPIWEDDGGWKELKLIEQDWTGLKWIEMDRIRPQALQIHVIQEVHRGSYVIAVGCQDELPAPVSGMAFAASGHLMPMGISKQKSWAVRESFELLQRHSSGFIYTEMVFIPICWRSIKTWTLAWLTINK